MLEIAYLRALLQNSKQLNDEEIGLILQLLRSIEYFRDINNKLGAQQLLLYIPILQYYQLDQGLNLIDQFNAFVLMEGELVRINEQDEIIQVITETQLIDMKQESYRILGKSKCKLLKICKHYNTKKVNAFNILKMKAKQKINKAHQQQKKIQKLNQQYAQICKIYTQIEIFTTLGTYDRNELIINSQLQNKAKGHQIHMIGDEINHIGYIISGRIKLNYELQNNSNNMNDNKLLNKYKINHKGQNKSINKILQNGDWIGLQQYLWNTNYISNGYINSITTKILWIPSEIFTSKFNQKINYNCMKRLISLIETKKIIMNGALNTRKQIENNNNNNLSNQNKNEIKNKLKQKIIKNQIQNKIQKNNNLYITWRKPKIQLNNQLIPDLIIHKLRNLNTNTKNNNNNYSLPKVIQRINMFPKQYQQSSKQPNIRKMIQDAKNNYKLIKQQINGNINHQYRNNYQLSKNKLINPQQIYHHLVQQTSKNFHTYNYNNNKQIIKQTSNTNQIQSIELSKWKTIQLKSNNLPYHYLTSRNKSSSFQKNKNRNNKSNSSRNNKSNNNRNSKISNNSNNTLQIY